MVEGWRERLPDSFELRIRCTLSSIRLRGFGSRSARDIDMQSEQAMAALEVFKGSDYVVKISSSQAIFIPWVLRPCHKNARKSEQVCSTRYLFQGTPSQGPQGIFGFFIYF